MRFFFFLYDSVELGMAWYMRSSDMTLHAFRFGLAGAELLPFTSLEFVTVFHFSSSFIARVAYWLLDRAGVLALQLSRLFYNCGYSVR